MQAQGLILKASNPTEGHGVIHLAHSNANHRKIQSPAVKLQSIKSQVADRLEIRIS